MENAIERAVALVDGDRLDLGDLPEEVREPSSAIGSTRTLEELERRHILAAIETNGGNRARAASALGIGTATLYRKLKRYRAAANRTR